MPTCSYRQHHLYYEFNNEGNGPVVVFINGITQRTTHWMQYAKALQQYGIRTITFDQIGQGASDKPVLDYDFDENPDILRTLLDHCGVEKAYIAGISFGGAIVLKFGLKYPERCAGLIPMSAFSELDGRLLHQGVSMYEGMVRIGFEYLIDWLIPINFSSKLIDGMENNIPAVRRMSANVNDLYSIQNLIESIHTMPKEGFTADLHKIQCPTMIMNGEYDYLTPRWAHELIRKHIKNSRLVLIQHAFHAFTMEYPDVSLRMIREFIQAVEEGRWIGDQTVWIANEDAKADECAFVCEGDHTRSLPLMKRPEGTPLPAHPSFGGAPRSQGKTITASASKAAPAKAAAPAKKAPSTPAAKTASASKASTPPKPAPKAASTTKAAAKPAPSKAKSSASNAGQPSSAIAAAQAALKAKAKKRQPA